MDEQLDDELEALEAIFGDEYQLLAAADGSSAPRVQVAMRDGPVALRLVFTLGRGYPEEPPAVGVHADAGVAAARRADLVRQLEGAARESLGMPMIYTLVEAAREWVAAAVVGGGDAEKEDGLVFETRDEEEERRVDEEEERKFRGTPVTAETFAEWNAQFEAERMAEAEERARAEAVRSKVVLKLTGRELFLQNKAVVSEEAESLWEEEAGLFDE